MLLFLPWGIFKSHLQWCLLFLFLFLSSCKEQHGCTRHKMEQDLKASWPCVHESPVSGQPSPGSCGGPAWWAGEWLEDAQALAALRAQPALCQAIALGARWIICELMTWRDYLRWTRLCCIRSGRNRRDIHNNFNCSFSALTIAVKSVKASWQVHCISPSTTSAT